LKSPERSEGPYFDRETRMRNTPLTSFRAPKDDETGETVDLQFLLAFVEEP